MRIALTATNDHAKDCNGSDEWRGCRLIPRLRMCWKICSGVSSLKGGTPVMNSNRITPSAHQSTALPDDSVRLVVLDDQNM
jgi:hypothetical protein